MYIFPSPLYKMSIPNTCFSTLCTVNIGPYQVSFVSDLTLWSITSSRTLQVRQITKVRKHSDLEIYMMLIVAFIIDDVIVSLYYICEKYRLYLYHI